MRVRLRLSFFFWILLASSSSASGQILTVSSNKTIVSPRSVFELGFFRRNQSSDGWYLGTWYKEDADRISLWVANIGKPLGLNGVLKFSDNNLALFNDSNDDSPVWTTNLTGVGARFKMVAQLLDNGNFVVKDSHHPDIYLWQSFDFPTDTLLPEMKLGKDPETGINKVLRSWNYDEEGIGYSLELKEDSGIFTIFLRDLASPEWSYRSDLWDGHRFGVIPRDILRLESKGSNPTEIAEDWFLKVGRNSSRLTISEQGDELILFTWVPERKLWNLTWSPLSDSCNRYKRCGPYHCCSQDTQFLCNCIQGFDMKLKYNWAEKIWRGVCERRTPLSCGEDKFLRLQNMKLPDTKGVQVDMEVGFKECEERCRRNCSCTAFAHVGILQGRSGCVIWTGELQDLRNYTVGGQDLYVKLAARDYDDETKKSKDETKKSKDETKKSKDETKKSKDETKKDTLGALGIILIIIGAVITILLLVIIGFCLWKRHKRNAPTVGQTQENLMIAEITEITETDRFVLMDLHVLVEATNNFSNANKLGQGGFGTVYKGTLPDGKEIAVKRLKGMSSQGINEFKNEVTLILRVLHVNLVRLLGCCFEGEEKILIYEYLGNSSLNRYLFDKTQSSLLNWDQRFKIVKGIAEGLSYLHNFTIPPILHRDLKPSNVLLDKDMIPKISDFGLAQTLESGKTEVETDRVVGTYGYMSEEYALHGKMSEKSDVFSYGVMLLEIITGRRNLEYCNTHQGDSRLDYVWRQWNEGRGLDVVDPEYIDGSFVEDQVLRSMQIGLMCVQEHVDDRPTTKSVVLMLQSTQSEIPKPAKPNYYYGRVGQAASSSSVPGQSMTTNYATVTQLEGR